MRQPLIQGEETTRRKVEGPALRSHLDVTGHGLNRDASLGLMSGETGVCFEGGEDDSEVLVLYKRLGILTAVPLGFAVKAADLLCEVEFEKWSGHGLRVRSSVLAMVVKSI